MVDNDCVRAGETIPVASPGYEHFGKGRERPS